MALHLQRLPNLLPACGRSLSTAAAATAAPAAATIPPQVATPSASASSPLAFPIGPSTAPSGKLKFKNSFKRASEVMGVVNRVAEENMAVKLSRIREPLPQFNVGDAIEINYAQELTEANPIPIRGLVMSKSNKGLDTKFTILNAWDGEYYTAGYVYPTPLLRGIKVLMKNRLKLSGLRVNRAKLTYLLGADPNIYFVDSNTKEPEVAQAEKEEKKRLRRLGKLGKKKSGSDRAAVAADKKAAAGGAAGGKDAGKGGAKAAAAPAKGAAKK